MVEVDEMGYTQFCRNGNMKRIVKRAVKRIGSAQWQPDHLRSQLTSANHVTWPSLGLGQVRQTAARQEPKQL